MLLLKNCKKIFHIENFPEIIDPSKGSFELNTDFAKMIQRF